METRIQGVPGHSWMRWWMEEVMSPFVECQLQTSFCLVWFLVLAVVRAEMGISCAPALEDDELCHWLFQKLCRPGGVGEADRSQYTKLGGQPYLCSTGLLGRDSRKGTLILIFSSTDAKLLEAAFSSGMAPKSGILYSSSRFFHK